MARSGGIYSTDEQAERSLRHSIKDGVWFSAMTGGAESYFSAYAIHLHASTTIIGLLASLPPLLGWRLTGPRCWVVERLTCYHCCWWWLAGCFW